MKFKKSVIPVVLFFLVLCTIVIAEPEIDKKVENSDYIIEATQDVYYCEPILSDEGCLISADFNISGKKVKIKYANISLLFNRDIKIKEFGAGSLKVKDDKIKIKIDKDEVLNFHVEFWIKEDGKFDVLLDDGDTVLYLDPFFNTSYNTSYPSYYAINGTFNDSNDNFDQIIDISSGLSDNSTSTSYLLRYEYFMPYEVDNRTDSEIDSAEELSKDDEIFAVDFYIRNKSILHEIQLCVYGSEETVEVNMSMTINESFMGYEFNFPTGVIPTSWSCRDIDKSYLSQGTNRLGVGCIGCGNSDRFFLGTDVDPPYNLSSYMYDGSSWIQESIVDYAMYIQYSEIYPEKQTVLVPFYNYTFNETNNESYWLNINSNITSLTNFTICTQINTTHPNISNCEQRLATSQSYFFSLENLIYDGYDEGLRVYAPDNYVIIYDMYLYVQEDIDVTPPTITNCSVNVTEFFCDDTVKVSCDVTDDEYVNEVFFYGVHANGTYEVMQAFRQGLTDHYTVELNYGFYLFDSYEMVFIKANATDISGNVAEVFPNINFNYTCLRNRSVYCFYNDQPYLRQWIPFSQRHLIDVFCEIEINDAECYLSILKDGNLLQVNPTSIQDTEDDILDSFITNGIGDTTLVRMHYSPKSLIAGESFELRVNCNNGIGMALTEFDVIPSYRNMDYVAHRGMFFKDNMNYIILFFLIIVFIVVIWKISRS